MLEPLRRLVTGGLRRERMREEQGSPSNPKFVMTMNSTVNLSIL